VQRVNALNAVIRSHTQYSSNIFPRVQNLSLHPEAANLLNGRGSSPRIAEHPPDMNFPTLRYRPGPSDKVGQRVSIWVYHSDTYRSRALYTVLAHIIHVSLSLSNEFEWMDKDFEMWNAWFG
jgi:hypothetical protein